MESDRTGEPSQMITENNWNKKRVDSVKTSQIQLDSELICTQDIIILSNYEIK